MSYSKTKPNSGNFTIIQKDSVKYVAEKLSGKKNVTSSDLFHNSRKPNLIGSQIEALNILYVLVALGKAKILKKRLGSALQFNVK